MSRSKKLFDCPGLPRGWKREECIMTTGLSTGKVAFRYYSPMGKRVTSKADLQRVLGDAFDLSTFDFNTGKFQPAARTRGRPPAGSSNSNSGGGGASPAPSQQQQQATAAAVALAAQQEEALRRKRDFPLGTPFQRDTTPAVAATSTTASSSSSSALPTSVVVVRNLASDGGKDNDSDKSNLPSSVTSSSNNHHKVKPAQVYWEKRLENVKPKYTYDRVWIASLGGEGNDNANDDDVDDDDDDDDGGGGGNNKKESGDEELLPAGLTPFPGLVDARTAVLSLAAHLTASRKRAFVGQRDHRGKVDKLPGVFVDPSEPLVKSFKISDKDLAAQEAKVNALRNKLAELQRQLMAP